MTKPNTTAIGSRRDMADVAQQRIIHEVMEALLEYDGEFKREWLDVDEENEQTVTNVLSGLVSNGILEKPTRGWYQAGDVICNIEYKSGKDEF